VVLLLGGAVGQRLRDEFVAFHGVHDATVEVEDVLAGLEEAVVDGVDGAAGFDLGGDVVERFHLLLLLLEAALPFDLLGDVLCETQARVHVAVGVAQRRRPHPPVLVPELGRRVPDFAVLDGGPEQRLEVLSGLVEEDLGHPVAFQFVSAGERVADSGPLREREPEVVVVHPDAAVREVLGERPVALLALGEFSLAFLALADVPDHREHLGQAVDDGPLQVDLHPEVAPLLRAEAPLERLGPLLHRSPDALHSLGPGEAGVVRAELRDVHLEYRLPVVAEHLDGPGVHVVERAGVGVVEEDGVRRLLEYLPVTRL